MSKGKDFVKNFIILTFGNLFPKMTGIIILPLITGGLSQNDLGTYDYITTLVWLLIPLSNIQIDAAAFRMLIDAKEQEKKYVVSTSIAFTILSAFGGMIPMALLLKDHSAPLLLTCYYFFVEAVYNTVKQIIRGFSLNKLYSFATVAQSLVNLLFVSYFIGFRHMGLVGILLAGVFAESIALIIVIVKGNINRALSFRAISINLLREMLNYSWPLLPNKLSLWVLDLSDRLVLINFIGAPANAIYSVANKFPKVVETLNGSYSMSWQESASKSSKKSDLKEYYQEMFKGTTSFLAAVVMATASITPILFNLFVKGNYAEARIHASILYISVFFSFINSFLGGIFIAQKNTREVAKTTLAAAIINLITDLLLITKMGIFAASLSTLLSCVYLTIHRIIVINRKYNISFNIATLLIRIIPITLISFVGVINSWKVCLLNIVTSIVLSGALNREILKKAYNRIIRKKA